MRLLFIRLLLFAAIGTLSLYQDYLGLRIDQLLQFYNLLELLLFGILPGALVGFLFYWLEKRYPKGQSFRVCTTLAISLTFILAQGFHYWRWETVRAKFRGHDPGAEISDEAFKNIQRDQVSSRNSKPKTDF